MIREEGKLQASRNGYVPGFAGRKVLWEEKSTKTPFVPSGTTSSTTTAKLGLASLAYVRISFFFTVHPYMFLHTSHH